MARIDDVLEAICDEYDATGTVPPPGWVAQKLELHRSVVSRQYSRLLADGNLSRPHGPRGGFRLLCRVLARSKATSHTGDN